MYVACDVGEPLAWQVFRLVDYELRSDSIGIFRRLRPANENPVGPRLNAALTVRIDPAELPRINRNLQVLCLVRLQSRTFKRNQCMQRRVS